MFFISRFVFLFQALSFGIKAKSALFSVCQGLSLLFYVSLLRYYVSPHSRFTAAFLWVLLLWTVQLSVTAAGWALYCCIVPSDLVAPAGQFLAFLQGWLWRLYPVQDLSALLGTVLLLVLMACCAAGAQTTFLYRGTRGGDSLSLVWAVAAVPVAWNLPLILDNRYFFTGIAAAVLAAVLLLDALKRCREVEEA